MDNNQIITSISPVKKLVKMFTLIVFMLFASCNCFAHGGVGGSGGHGDGHAHSGSSIGFTHGDAGAAHGMNVAHSGGSNKNSQYTI